MSPDQINQAAEILREWQAASRDWDAANERMARAAKRAARLLGVHAYEVGWGELIRRLAEEITWSSLGGEAL